MHKKLTDPIDLHEALDTIKTALETVNDWGANLDIVKVEGPRPDHSIIVHLRRSLNFKHHGPIYKFVIDTMMYLEPQLHLTPGGCDVQEQN